MVCARQENNDSSMGNDALDLAREKISQMGQETRGIELADMPVRTVGIIVGATALLLGLGRLPAMFWLIGTAVLSVRSSWFMHTAAHCPRSPG